MLSPYQRAIECLGPFVNEEDNLKKYREYFEKEDKQKADLKKAIREATKNSYFSKKKLFDDHEFKKKSDD